MLHLNTISLIQFKNYPSSTFSFTERITGICGLNGKGKTNLLDAIYYLCFTKSYFSRSDILNTQFNSEGFRLEGNVTRDGDFSIVIILRATGKKEISINEVPYEKFSSHIGKFPCVMIAPDDIDTITGGSEQRRKFMDTVLSEMDQEYLQLLITYNKVLQQRNSLLKNFAEQKQVDKSLLDVLDEQLIHPGKGIYERRKNFCDTLFPHVQKFYAEIADNKESIQLKYESQLNENAFDDLVKNYRDKDLLLQRTNAGIHKDDIAAQLDGHGFKNIASQGQKKSLLFALKLAEFELLKENKGFAPLLLLDDVFEKLDDIRMQNLLQWVCVNNDGQVFITDTHEERLRESLNKFGLNFQVIELK